LNEELERQESTGTLWPGSAKYEQKIAVLDKMWVTILFSLWREDVTTSSLAERSYGSQQSLEDNLPVNLQPPIQPRKRRSADPLAGHVKNNKRAHKGEIDKLESKPPAELVLDRALNLILKLDQSGFVGSAVYFLKERGWDDCVLLYCANGQLEESELHQDLVFTEEELALTAHQSRRYTGDRESNVAEKLNQLIVSLIPLLTTDFTKSRQQEITSFRGI
jgi:hypothetical protein